MQFKKVMFEMLRKSSKHRDREGLVAALGNAEENVYKLLCEISNFSVHSAHTEQSSSPD